LVVLVVLVVVVVWIVWIDSVGSIGSVGSVDCVDSVNSVDRVDRVDRVDSVDCVATCRSFVHILMYFPFPRFEKSAAGRRASRGCASLGHEWRGRACVGVGRALRRRRVVRGARWCSLNIECWEVDWLIG